MDRRSFLGARHLNRAAQNWTGADDNAPSAGAITLTRVSRPAMATVFEIVAPFGTENAVERAEAALDEIDRLESSLTAYRDSSDICRINRLASDSPVQVNDELFQLLSLSDRLHRQTEGAFDITSGPLTKAWGFFGRCQRWPTRVQRSEALDRVGGEHIELDPHHRTVRYRKSGVEINLGSIGKGYALDRAAEVLVGGRREAFFLSGGRSSALAIGSPPGERRGWPVAIRHPWDPQRRLGTVRLRGRALATSAATYQHFEVAGRRLGHIIDPRTGWPAHRIASATVLAPTAAEADALATAFFIQGDQWAYRFCQNHPDVSAIILPAEAEQPLVINFQPGSHDWE
jgi:thiamine biosynthesis lipoprotein